ncbi:hypothetical protein [Glycomyces salinus]|uniref:hypothetical protein n=1 Tax=Glycomyces salinus TaxID=980294 RepID=UPI0018ED72C8|nr:hypothetical protein [Glycomyces salinus]
MKRILQALVIMVGGYLIFRAAVDPFLRDPSDPSTFQDDWGGPTYIGALAVHMGPGIIFTALFSWWFVRARLARAAKKRQEAEFERLP